MKITDIASDYNREFDISALDRSTPWLPPAPVKDVETSETRGVVEDTLTERGKNYGDFTDNSSVAQNIKLAMRESPRWRTDSVPFDMMEALDLIASKIGRMLSGNPNYIDNWHDIAGYATLIENRLKQTEQK